MIVATYRCPMHKLFAMTLYSDAAPMYLDCPTCGVHSRIEGNPERVPIPSPSDYYKEAMNTLNRISPIDWAAIYYESVFTKQSDSTEKKKQVYESLAREAMLKALDQFQLEEENV